MHVYVCVYLCEWDRKIHSNFFRSAWIFPLSLMYCMQPDAPIKIQFVCSQLSKLVVKRIVREWDGSGASKKRNECEKNVQGTGATKTTSTAKKKKKKKHGCYLNKQHGIHTYVRARQWCLLYGWHWCERELQFVRKYKHTYTHIRSYT